MAIKPADQASIQKSTNSKTRPHIRPIPIEGFTLHIRTIIEQGRMMDYLKACKDNGFDTVKAQKGLVEFSRQFINNGGNTKRTKPIDGAECGKFVAATQRKTRKADHCD